MAKGGKRASLDEIKGEMEKRANPSRRASMARKFQSGKTYGSAVGPVRRRRYGWKSGRRHARKGTTKRKGKGKGKDTVKRKGKERPLTRWTKNEKVKTQKAFASTEASKLEGEDLSLAKKRKEPAEGSRPRGKRTPTESGEEGEGE